MDFLPDVDTLSLWLTQHGSLALFILLCLGIIVLPVPEETLMIIAGALMRHEKLPIPSTVIAAISGSLCGITVSYLLGRLAGEHLLTKHGRWIGLTAVRREKFHKWFVKFGKWALLIGYFIPGVRHFTGFTAGSSKLDIKSFALYAYVGGIIWVSLFLSIGYFSGHYLPIIYEERTIDSITFVCILAIVGYVLYLVKRKRF